MAERPQVIGPDSGPEAPFPLRMGGKVVSGFGRGSKEVCLSLSSPHLFQAGKRGVRSGEGQGEGRGGREDRWLMGNSSVSQQQISLWKAYPGSQTQRAVFILDGLGSNYLPVLPLPNSSNPKTRSLTHTHTPTQTNSNRPPRPKPEIHIKLKRHPLHQLHKPHALEPLPLPTTYPSTISPPSLRPLKGLALIPNGDVHRLQPLLQEPRSLGRSPRFAPL